MWKRMTDRLSEAVSTVAAATTTATRSSSSTATGSSRNENDIRVSQLAAMGFREAEVRHALRMTHGNVPQATEWLLQHGTPMGIDFRQSTATTTTRNTIEEMTTTRSMEEEKEEEDIQRAIKASLDPERLLQHNTSNKNNIHSNKKSKSQAAMKTAASHRAGQAAGHRLDPQGTLSIPTTTTPSTKKTTGMMASHPNVQIPKRLSQYDKEDVIVRCAARIAFHPTAVDTLLRSLKTIQANPNTLKYQTIDPTTMNFQRSLNKPGVMDFLKAMNFHPILIPGTNNSSNGGKHQVLRLTTLDPATFFLGISALEQVQQTSPDYANNKVLLQFDKEIDHALLLGDSDMTEALKRSEYMSKCPSESTTGSGSSLVIVELGSKKISRKFDGDDTLRDVVHWLGGHASIIPFKLMETNEWHLIDRNHPNALPYQISHNENNNNNHTTTTSTILDQTLQYIGCWPSGRLAIVPTLPHPTTTTTFPTIVGSSNTTNGGHVMINSSRGLGAGPTDQ